MVRAVNAVGEFLKCASRRFRTLHIVSSAHPRLNPPETSNNIDLQGARLPFNRYVVFFALAGVGVGLDLLTKKLVFAQYFDPTKMGVKHWWIDGVFGIETSTNGGALFGMFQGGSTWLAGLSIIALIGIFVWLFVYRMAHSVYLTIALGLVTGGILGNIYDRMGFGFVSSYPEAIKYHVRDWIHFRLNGVPLFDPWPNFNIADSLLVCGAIMLFLFAVFGPGKPKKTA